jgi:DNA-binding transcriptional ArsR family regulator
MSPRLRVDPAGAAKLAQTRSGAITRRVPARRAGASTPAPAGLGIPDFTPGLIIRTTWLTLPHVVNYYRQLDQTFAALADPTRRAVLARLERQDGVSVSEFARPFAITLPAVMKHLDVLDDAGLITRSKAGRVVTVWLSSEPIKEAMNWLRRYERFWSGSPDRLATYVEDKEARQSDR